MTSSQRYLAILIITNALWVGSCSSPSSPTNSSAAGGALTSARREAILDELTAQYETLLNTDSAHASTKLRASMDTIPEIVRTGIEYDGSVAAEFSDSSLFIASDNLAPDVQKAYRPPPPPPRARSGKHGTMALEKTAIIKETFGTGYDSTLGSDINSYMATQGYIASQTPFLASEFKEPGTLSGVLLLHTHGNHYDHFFVRSRNGDSVDYGTLSTLWTDERVNPTSEENYKDDLKTHAIVRNVAPKRDVYVNGKRGVLLERHYAITEKFVQQYMKFDSTSFVVLAACKGFSFAPVLLQKGANTVIGWDSSVNSAIDGRAIRTIFDQLLGAGLDTQNKFTPPERPFWLSSILDELQMLGWDNDPASHAQLHSAYNPIYDRQSTTQSYMLAPTIEHLSFEDTAYNQPEILTIHWDGPKVRSLDEVSITIDGVPMTRWVSDPPDTILKVKLPDSGPGSAGNVVISIDGVKSNPVPLTDWRGTVHLKNTAFVAGAPITLTVDYDLHFRTDGHYVRQAAGATWLGLFEDPVVMVRDSKCHWHLTGQYSAQGYSYTYYGDGFNPLTVGLGRNLGGGQYQIPDSQWFGKFNFLGPQGSYMILISGGGKFSLTTVDPQGVTTKTEESVSQQSSQFSVVVDTSTYTIQAGSHPSGSLTWGNITPTFPPNGNTPGIARRTSYGDH